MNAKLAAICFLLATFFVTACSKQDNEADKAAQEAAIQKQLSQAQTLLFNGDTQGALNILEALDTDHENHPEIIEQLAFAYAEVPDPTLAGIYFDRVYQLDPSRSDIALFAASAHSEGGDWEAAARSYENYLKAEPLDAGAWKSLARTYQQAGKLQPALDAWLRAFRTDKSKPDAAEAVLVGDLCYALNNRAQAERWWNHALEQPNVGDAHAEATLGKLRLALAKEQWGEAETLVKTVQQRYPGALEEAGLESVPSQLADLREATTLVTTTAAEGVEITKPDDETEENVTNVADIEDEGPTKLSVIEDEETVVTPEQETITTSDGSVLVAQLQVEEPEPESPDSPGVITVSEGNATVTYAAGPDGPTKLSVIEEEVEEENLAPTPLAETEEELPPPPAPAPEPTTLFAQGTTALQNAEFPEAIRYLQLSLANEDPNNANAFYDLSRAYYGIGQWQQAELYASEALRRQPDNLFYEVQYLRVLQKSQSRQKLMEELVRAHDMFPSSPDIALALARGYDYIEKNPRNATYMYETFLELAPMDHPMRPEIEQYLSGQ